MPFMGRAVSGCYPRWLGWVAVLARISRLQAALSRASVGEPTGASRVLTIIGPTVITLWRLSMAIMLLRKVRETTIRAVETDAQDAA